tara:strand:- start:1948 stop:2727 length:780 start_codon:yes stop_codon:yes gene_type:complete
MIDKHAVWCQCASVVPMTMTVASLLSCQWITVDMDIYWTCVFGITACTHFISAEHANVFFKTSTWQDARIAWNFALHVIFFMWSIHRWRATHQLVLLPVYFAIGRYLSQYGHHISAVTGLYQLVMHGQISPVPLMFGLERIEIKQNKKTLQTSIADIHIKRLFLIRAVRVISLSGILWSLRCQNRFPHTLRKTPIFASVVAFSLAVTWCHYNVKKTRVSQNAIIKSLGHGVAASLNAAESCPICRKCLTSLDMESSFGD